MKKSLEEINVVLVCEDTRKSIEGLYVLPRKGEILQYNGIPYLVEQITHHYKEGFAPYIELMVMEITM